MMMFLLFSQLCLCQWGPRWNLTDWINWLLCRVEAKAKLSDIGGTGLSEVGGGGTTGGKHSVGRNGSTELDLRHSGIQG